MVMERSEPVAQDVCRGLAGTCGAVIHVYLNKNGLAYSNCPKCRRQSREFNMNSSKRYLEALGVSSVNHSESQQNADAKKSANHSDSQQNADAKKAVNRSESGLFTTLLGMSNGR